jgi:chemotaxis protein MotB
MESEPLQPIIVIKKKGGHGGHHGGAWKVAYADFVTAMMSLFIVLWLMSSTSKQTQEEIAGYFHDPKGVNTKKGGDGKAQVKENSAPDNKEVVKKEDMAALKKELEKAIASIDALNKLKNQIEMTVTDEGLRIELIENDKGTFFETGSAQATPVLTELLGVLTGQLKDLPNSISIEGHTDAQPYATQTNYGNWELSTDRANVARRAMQGDGVRLDQVSQVRGFAAQRLHTPSKPFDASNRRVSLVVQNMPKKAGPKEAIAEGKPAAEPGKGEGVKAEAGPAKAEVGEAKPTATAAAGETASAAMVLAPAAAEKSAGGLLARAKGMFHH